jgi:lipoic acid synthetase
LDKKPQWLKKKIRLDNKNISAIKNLIDSSRLHTVCQSAKCPNIFECFSKRTATFMLMGDTCTRNCGFCGVNSGKPLPLDKEEPKKIASAIKEMDLLYAVITSVTRDDLDDGGASHFAETVKVIKKINPDTRIECLIPDFGGNKKNLETLLSEELDVLNHNIETIKQNYSRARSSADYDRSLKLLKNAKEIRPGIYTKSGFMLGLGENTEKILKLLKDLKESEVDIITIGQYLSPSKDNIAISKYYTPEEFKEIEKTAIKIGFAAVAAGPFVRSSYGAELVLDKALENK